MRAPVIRSHVNILTISLIVLTITSALDVCGHLILDSVHATIRETFVIGSLVPGCVAGLLVWHLMVINRHRRLSALHDLETTANLNHHVRNALQVLSYYTHGQPLADIEILNTEIERIQWAMNEFAASHVNVSPTVVDHPFSKPKIAGITKR